MFCSDQCVAQSRRRKKFEYSENWEPARIVGLPSPCMECTSHKMLRPTGYFSVSTYGQRILLHRFNYEEMHGPIPQGMLVLHKCDNAKCCNPEHLYVGTQRQNIDDMIARNRLSVGEAKSNSKLCVDQILEIRRLGASNLPSREIAKKFPVSRDTINRIIARKAWKHVK